METEDSASFLFFQTEAGTLDMAVPGFQTGALPIWRVAATVSVADQRRQPTRRGLRAHRQEVQLVLQDPDDQLFSASVAQDVSFGPLNLGLPEDAVRERVAEALDLLDRKSVV